MAFAKAQNHEYTGIDIQDGTEDTGSIAKKTNWYET